MIQSPAYSSFRHASFQKNRAACKRCRVMKVRCKIDESERSDACLRCSKANAQCIPDRSPAPKRRVGGPADQRVEELEKALKQAHGAIRVLEEAQSSKFPIPREVQALYSPGGAHIQQPALSARLLGPATAPDSILNPFEDIINGMITLKQARDLFDHFTRDLLPACPIVSFPYESFDAIRSTNPLKLHAIICGAMNTMIGFDNFSLEEGLRRHLADRLLVAMDTDEGIIEAIFIIAYWLSPGVDSKRIAPTLMLVSIYHTLSVFNISSDTSNNLQLYRHHLTAFIYLGGLCSASARNFYWKQLVSWSPTLQQAYDTVALQSESPVDQLLLVSARSMRLDQDMAAAFDVKHSEINVSDIKSSLILFKQKIEEMKELLLLNRLLYFEYLTRTTLLHAYAVRYLPKSETEYMTNAWDLLSATHQMVDFFISCRDVLNTFPTFAFYKPIKAIILMQKYETYVANDPNELVGARSYTLKLLECLRTSQQTPSVKRTFLAVQSLNEEIHKNAEYHHSPVLSAVSKWDVEVDVLPEVAKGEDDWAQFMRAFHIPESESEFWDMIGL